MNGDLIFFGGSYFCLSVYMSTVLVVLFWLLFTLVLYVSGIFYHADVPVHTLLQADTNTSQTGTQQLATEMPLHMLPYSMVLCVCSVVVDC